MKLLCLHLEFGETNLEGRTHFVQLPLDSKKSEKIKQYFLPKPKIIKKT